MPTTPGCTDRGARLAVATLFLANGALVANLLPRLPEIKTALGLSNTAYGTAVAAFSVGALLAGPAGGVLVRRVRSARLAVAATVVLAVSVLAAAAAPTPAVFAAALAAAGAADALTDVAQNVHGLRVQRSYGRSIINSLHAVWSAGAVLGGLMGAGAIAAGLSPVGQLGCSGLLFGAASVIAFRFLLPGPDEPAHRTRREQRPPARASTYPALAALVGIAVAGAVVEDVGNSWATLYLRDQGVSAAIAPLGYVALVGRQFLGRLGGDGLVDRFGARAVSRAGGIVAVVGMGTALAHPHPLGTVAGFAAAGFGVATAVPAAMHGADELPGLRAGTGLAAVNWLMRVGFLVSSPIIGAIADSASLRVGLLAVPVAGLTVVLLSGVLPRRRRVREPGP